MELNLDDAVDLGGLGQTCQENEGRHPSDPHPDPDTELQAAQVVFSVPVCDSYK